MAAAHAAADREIVTDDLVVLDDGDEAEEDGGQQPLAAPERAPEALQLDVALHELVLGHRLGDGEAAGLVAG